MIEKIVYFAYYWRPCWNFCGNHYSHYPIHAFLFLWLKEVVIFWEIEVMLNWLNLVMRFCSFETAYEAFYPCWRLEMKATAVLERIGQTSLQIWSHFGVFHLVVELAIVGYYQQILKCLFLSLCSARGEPHHWCWLRILGGELWWMSAWLWRLINGLDQRSWRMVVIGGLLTNSVMLIQISFCSLFEFLKLVRDFYGWGLCKISIERRLYTLWL